MQSLSVLVVDISVFVRYCLLLVIALNVLSCMIVHSTDALISGGACVSLYVGECVIVCVQGTA